MSNTNQQDNLQSREIRIFISSTFRDMQAERDVLIKHIFPQLRKICEQRGVTFTEVDLRWGITDEQKAEGKVLPICLAEIHNCRPYFIGLLGERYGWVPDSFTPEILEQQEWLQNYSGRSVTELEIIHGVLNNPDMAEHAYFYFRDPQYIIEHASEFQLETTNGPEQSDEENTEKLLALKDRIRQSGFPTRENFKNPQALGEMVLADMQALINQLFPQQENPDPMLKETAVHEMYAANLARTYIKNQNNFEALSRHVEGSGPPLVILGESGSGKSALLANWVNTYQTEHPDSYILSHFIGASPFSSNWVNMLQRILNELKRKFEIQETIPEKPDALRTTFAKWLNLIANKNKVILVLDALNQLEDQDGAPDLVWLPAVLPDNIRLIVSTLSGRSLDEIQKRAWPKMEIKTLEIEDRKKLIHQYLAQYKKSLNSELVSTIANSEQASNPLFLRAVLEELRVFGKHDDLKNKTDYYLKSKTTLELFDKILERYETDYEGENPGMVTETLRLLWASRHGLQESELLDLLGKDGQPLPRAIWTPFYLASGQSLINRSGFIGFGHDYFREAVYLRYVKDQEGQKSAHLRLADYFGQTPTAPRSLEELPWQLSEARSWEKLVLLLTDPEFFKKAWNLNRYDLISYWLKLEKNTDYRIVDGYSKVIQAPQNFPQILLEISLLLTQTGHFAESQKLLDYVLANRSLEINPDLLQAALGNQGYMAYVQGDYKRALKSQKSQEKICREVNHLYGLQYALGSQAITLNSNGDLTESMKLSKEQEKICRENGFYSGLQSSLGNQGKILSSRGELQAAMHLFQEQEKVSLAGGDIGGLQAAYENQGIVHYLQKNLDEALRLFKKEEKFSRDRSGDLNVLEACLGNQGLVLNAKSDLEGALQLYKEQEAICNKLGDRIGLSSSLGNQGFVMRDLGKRDKAMELFKEQEKICQETGYKIGLQNALGSQAYLLLIMGNPEEALHLFERQEQICRELDYKTGLLLCMDRKGQALLERGDLKASLVIYEELEKIYREENNQQRLQYILTRLSTIKKAQGNLQDMRVSVNQSGQIRRELAEKGEPGFAAFKKQATVIRKEDIDKGLISPELKQQFDLKKIDAQAKSLMDKGDWNGALKIYKEKEEICRKLGNKEELDKTLSLEEKIYEADGNWEAVLQLKEKRIRNAREMNHIMLLITVLKSYAEILKGQGEINKVLQLYKEIEINTRAMKANPGKMPQVAQMAQLDLVIASLQQAEIYEARGNLDEAMVRYKKIEDQCRKSNDNYGIHNSLIHQAKILKKRGDFHNALELIRTAKPFKKKAGFGSESVVQAIYQVIDYEEAALLYKSGNREEALVLYDKQEAHCRNLKNMDELQKLFSYKAETLKDSGDLSGTMDICKLREQVCKENNHDFGLQGSLGSMAEIYEESGEFDKALKLNKEKEEICRKINNPYNLQKSMSDQVRLLAKMGDFEGSLSLFENLENYCRNNGYLEKAYFTLSNCERLFREQTDPAILEKALKKKDSLKGELNKIIKDEITPELFEMVSWPRQQLNNRVEKARKERENSIQKSKFAPKLSVNVENEYKLLEDQARRLKPRIHFKQLLQIYQKQEQLAAQSGDRLSLGKCHCNLGILFKENGDPNKAMESLSLSEKIYRETDYQEGLQLVLENQGAILKSKGDLHSALRKFEEQEKICREKNLQRKLITALDEGGDIHRSLKNYEKAFEKFNEKLVLCKKNRRVKRAAKSSWGYGMDV